MKKNLKQKTEFFLVLFTVTILFVSTLSGLVFATNIKEASSNIIIKQSVSNVLQSFRNSHLSNLDNIASISDITEISFNEVEPNNNIISANQINGTFKDNEIIYDCLGYINDTDYDIDYYKFTVTDSGVVYLIGLWSGEYMGIGYEEDLYIDLYDSNNNLIKSSTLGDFDGLSASGLSKSLTPGTYYFTISENINSPYTYVGDQYCIGLQYCPSVTGVSMNKTSTTLAALGATEQLTATITPSYATNQNVIWSSSNTNIATVNTNGIVKAVNNGTTVITATTQDGNYSATCNVTVQTPAISVKYRTHVQDFGWQSYASDGIMSGTSGQSKRLEGINIQVSGDTNLGVKYMTQVQDYGWQTYVNDGALSGTSGQSKRLEAIKIALTGTDADIYDIYYRVHAQDYGWLDWAKNGEAAGTEGLSKRLEGIEIKIVAKGEDPGLTTSRPFVSVYGTGNIIYKTHVQDYGWQNFVSDGTMSGTSGQSKRLEGISIRLGVNLPAGSVVYTTHVQDYGWLSQVSNGTMSGTSGQSKRLEAIRINLTGEIANQYDIYYRVHAQNVGWMGWAKNGQDAGTAGYSYRLEGIEIQLVAKGGAAPGSTTNAFVSR